MTTDIVQTMTVNDRDVVQAYQRQAKELEKERRLREQMDKEMTAAAKRQKTFRAAELMSTRKAAAEQERLAKIARKAIDSTRTPFERYEKQLHDLNQALAAGKLKTEDFRRAKFALLRELREAKRDHEAEARALDKSRRAQDAVNKELREAASVVAQTRTATERYELAVERLNKMRQRGRISGTVHARALAQEKLRLDQASAASGGWSRNLVKNAAALTGVATGAAAVMKIVQLLRSEYDRLIERQSKAGDRQITLAAAQSQAVKNLGNDPELDAAGLFGLIRDEAGRLGVSELSMTRAASGALSARGDLTARQAVESVVAAREFERFADEDTNEALAASSADIHKKTGLDFRESLGFLSTVGQISRVTKTDSLVQHVAPAILNAMSGGVSKEFAGAAMGALTQGSVDKSGRVSRTALTRLVSQLKDFSGKTGMTVEESFAAITGDAQKRDEFLKAGGLTAKDMERIIEEGGGVDAATLQQKFLDESSFEAKSRFAVQDLLTPGTRVNDQFLASLQRLRAQDPKAQFESVKSQQESLPAVRTAMVGQLFSSADEAILSADTAAGQSGQIREGLKNLRQSLGRSGYGSRLQGFLEDFNNGGVLDLDDAREAVLAEQESLLTPRAKAGPFMPDSPLQVDPTKVSDEAKRNAEILEKVVDRLDALIDQGKQQQERQGEAAHAGAVAGRARNQGEGGF